MINNTQNQKRNLRNGLSDEKLVEKQISIARQQVTVGYTTVGCSSNNSRTISSFKVGFYRFVILSVAITHTKKKQLSNLLTLEELKPKFLTSKQGT